MLAAAPAAHAARPTACFTQSPTDAVAGEPVTFDSSCSSDRDGQVVGRAWDTDDDGRYDDFVNQTAISVTFPEPGTYRVKLGVVDDDDDFDAEVRTVTVNAPPPPPPEPPPPAPPAEPAPVFPAEPQPPRLLDPFPTVRIRGRTTVRGVKLTLLRVRAPAGATVRLLCGGDSCPRKSMSALVRSRFATGYVRFRRIERSLLAGTVLRVYVMQDGMVGKYTRFKIRRLELPARTDRCLMPGSTKPVSCP